MNVKKILIAIRIQFQHVLYAIHLYRIRKSLQLKKGKKLSVFFLVNDNTKWNAQSVYMKFKKDSRFNAHIFVCRQEQTDDEQKTRNGYQEDCRFFEERNIPFIKGFDEFKQKNISLLQYKPDIVFYIQPWGWKSGLYDITTIGKKALTAYIPYSLPLCNDKNDNQLTFHLLVSFFYLPTEMSLKINRKDMMNKAKNCIVVGYPKLDEYSLALTELEHTQPKIIYAPHHSFTGRLCFSTFKWNGRELLEYARTHPQTNWVFKPHPRLKFELVHNGIMTLEEANDYYDQWDTLLNTERYESGNYIDLFAKSEALITDCISFLGEYLPSGHPVLLLENKDSAGYNEFGNAIISSYYRCRDWKTLEETIESVIINKKDPIQPLRKNAQNSVFPIPNSADIIHQHISNIFLTGEKFHEV